MTDQPQFGTSSAATPAGWYPDPATPGGQRYWDGTAWTPHTAAAAAAVAPSAPSVPSAPAASAYGSGGEPGAYGRGYAAAGGAMVVTPAKFGFATSVRRALRKFSDFSGRATVGEYWWFWLFEILLLVPLYILALIFGVAGATITDQYGDVTRQGSSGAGAVAAILGIVILVLILLFILPALAVSVRRLHDTDKSGWWYLISFVPFGGLVLLVFFVMAGTPGQNQYGPVVTE